MKKENDNIKNLKQIIMKEILIYKGVMQRLTVSQNLQILHAIHKEVQAYAMRAPGIQPVFETFGTELSNLDGFFKKNSKAFETEEIVKKDAARDFTVRATVAKVQYHYDFAMTGVEKEEARRLVYIVEKYGKLTKKRKRKYWNKNVLNIPFDLKKMIIFARR
ncbi:MAG: hypothetical protein LBM08_01545 [Dysgonamonadaceae bacterium]|nr:hypothetical protein [Dysgonamonadaceae bacterium]